MPNIVGWTANVTGLALWCYGYYVGGAPPIVNWAPPLRGAYTAPLTLFASVLSSLTATHCGSRRDRFRHSLWRIASLLHAVTALIQLDSAAAGLHWDCWDPGNSRVAGPAPHSLNADKRIMVNPL